MSGPPHADAPAVEMEGVVVRFGSTVALDGFDLTMPAGEILGLLGPNGSGKTTAVKVLATLLRADEGRASVFGYDVASEASEVRRHISLAGQYAAVDELLTGHQNLKMFGQLFGLGRDEAGDRADELLRRFDLAEAGDRQAKGYSGGMRRRLDLASALLTDPDLLFLDEPTTGLDLRSRQTIWDVVKELAAGGATILLTTQYLDEADALSDRIAVMDHGRVIASGTARQLKGEAGGLVIELRAAENADDDRVREVLRKAEADDIEEVEPLHYLIGTGDDPVAELGRMATGLSQGGVGVETLALRGPDLDDVFLRLTGDHTARA
ncbi:MAG: ATP-binding cassette domain-containing protein [Acidimicrobiales bacterium]